jgi:transposase
LYQRWRRKLDVVMRQEHKAGEKAFVDWAGDTIPIHDPATGEVRQAPLFVAALGASSYTWAEATRDQQMESWRRAHVHALPLRSRPEPDVSQLRRRVRLRRRARPAV